MQTQAPSKIMPQWHENIFGFMNQFTYFEFLFDQIKDIPGVVVECGTGVGGSLSMLVNLASRRNVIVKVIGFDSFEGWPEPDPVDISPRNPQKGEWKFTETELREVIVKWNLPKYAPDIEVEIIGGFLGETLPKFPEKQIVFLHLDLDLYEGYRDALRYLYPMVVSGGIIAFDEYKEFPKGAEYGEGTIEKWPGCTKAVDEFFRGMGYTIKYYPPTKKYYIVKR
jgi:hypothetical protein